MRTWAVRCAIVAVTAALGTVLMGWWTIPIIGAVRGGLPGSSGWGSLEAGAGAGLAWAALLTWTALQGPAGELSMKVGAVLGLPGPGLFGVTVLFAVLLAGAAAAFAGSLRK